MDTIFTNFLSSLKVKHTPKNANRFYNEHPYKYSLFGLSKMLSEYNVENIAVKAKNKEADIFELFTPFVAYLGTFVLVYKVTKDKVSYLWDGKDITLSMPEFIKSWTGVALLAEPDEKSIEPDYKNNRLKYILDLFQKGVLLTCIAGLIIWLYLSNSLYVNIGFSLLLLLNFVGVYIGYLLVQKQMHIHSEYADKICSLFKQGDCNDVLESSAAKLWGIFGWSEIGLGYFIANMLVLLVFPQYIYWLSLINICALPYSFWSVWYQKFKAKQWCPLCLIVQVLFWAIFAVNVIFGYIVVPELSLLNIFLVGCIYLVPILSINILIPSLSKGEKNEQITYEINSIKATEDVFISLLKQQPYYEVTKDISKIIFGNPDADILITVLTNPHCNPCSKMHKRINNLLQENEKSICIQYIYSSFNEKLKSSSKFLIATYLEKENESHRIYNEWFEGGRVKRETFFSENPVTIEAESVKAEFLRHEAWQEDTQLRATPTILVNGYKLPDKYKIEDLRYFNRLDL
ncbi:thioredoxin domain-containing protein [Parabacteroides sp. OttesenSCG-928-G21]|nr:thioredoxin domain-containing protein [Parabacteroides sp. OttesenSCG-928-G21]